MSCLGGGPGSDLVGALKYMAEAQVAPALFCEIVDGCVQWKRTWSDLAFSLDLKTPVHTAYVIHDVADKKTWDSPCSFEKADLFTINFFASEVTSLRQPAKDYFKFAFDRAKTNAFVLLNDNNDTRFYQWVDAVAKAAGFDQLLAEDGQRKIYDVEERRSAVGKCAEKFKGSSKLTGQLAWRVLRKR